MDIVSKAKRSEIMSRIRSSGSVPETRLFHLVRHIIRDSSDRRRLVRRNVRKLAGRPDIYVPSLRLAVFLDSCFFHGCPVHGRIPATNTGYWQAKIEANAKRDLCVAQELRRQSIAVCRVWEHDLAGMRLARTAARIQTAVRRAAGRCQ